MKRWLSAVSLDKAIWLYAFFQFAWLPDMLAMIIRPRNNWMVWQVRLGLLPLFAALGYMLFRPEVHLMRKRKLYITCLGSFLAGLVFYYLLITFGFQGQLYDLGETNMAKVPIRNWCCQHPGPYQFSWQNYLLYPAMILLCLMWRPTLEGIKTRWVLLPTDYIF